MNPLTPILAASLAADRQRQAATARRARATARAHATAPRRLRPPAAAKAARALGTALS
jgi:hypothetical protein